MVKRCLEEDRALGIVLIRSGSDVGAPAVPFDVGTLARIVRVDHRDDGSFNLAIVGERRFRIQALVDGEPYAVGDVEVLDEEVPDVSDRLVAEVRARFQEYAQTLRRLAQRQAGTIRVPDGALELSYVVAANVQITRQEQQALLEAPSAKRLQQESALLRRELAMIQQLGAVTARRVLAPSELSLN